eukprot:TRINITY_DN1263_c0_g1_i4.p1 TRINITY_DN1263_c0_g1~~TRINITY_DN1263_c0_g1_i4.p1  ORF type:complete len:146 (-),score=18.44 TRINITY_DN1263_c0_g1_i4:111-503(-)
MCIRDRYQRRVHGTKMSDNPVIHIGGLSPSIDENIVYAAFVPFGEVKTVDLPHDPLTTAPKGYAFVEYEDASDCLHAIANMDGAELLGKVIHVSHAKNPKFRDETNRPIWAEEKFILSKAEAEEKEPEAH